MSAKWKPDTWKTLCNALGDDPHLMVWTWDSSSYILDKESELRDVMKLLDNSDNGDVNFFASLEDPRTKSAPPKIKEFEPYTLKGLFTGLVVIFLFLAIAISDIYSNGYKKGQIDTENGIHRDAEGEKE